MNVQQRLQQRIDQRVHELRAGVPADRQAVILALVRAQDRLAHAPGGERLPDLITGRRLVNLGGAKALQLGFEATGVDAIATAAPSGGASDGWSERFLEECGRLAEAELVLAHCETGFMRMVEEAGGVFNAWIMTKRPPTSWRERADIDWWAALLAKRTQPELRALQSKRPDPESSGASDNTYYRRLAGLHLKMMAYQLGYPPDAVIDGCSVQTYCDILGLLIAWTLCAHDRGEAATPYAEQTLVSTLAAALGLDAALINRAVDAFTLDQENAAYHAAVPGVAAAPLVRAGGDRLVASRFGLTTEPLLFLARELRRRNGQEYNNSAYLREDFFRQDLYALFQDRRFVTSTTKLALRREAGDVRTDIDAVVFDRKSGTLAFFELKTQDPFARSTAEQTRQRDNVLYANRQISGVLTWLNRYGGDELLKRVDARTAKTFRVQKVYPFVLGRYLAHFTDGAEPDRRAAWGTWPQLQRLLDEQPAGVTGSNPLASLFTRLTKDNPRIHLPEDGAPRQIAVGDAQLIVYPSYAAFQASG